MSNPPHGIACLVVLVGPPGSGKSAWARRNGNGAVHVSQDDLIDAISPDGFEHVYRPIYGAAEDAVARAALEHGQTVIVDRTNRTQAHRRRWLQIAWNARCPVVAVIMTASASLCRERNRRREGPRRLSEARMERMLEAFEPVQPWEGFSAIYDESASLSEILERVSVVEGLKAAQWGVGGIPRPGDGSL
jgi:predicted kinase